MPSQIAVPTNYVDPVSRIEGHLGINLTVNAGVIDAADVHGNLWRGFENFLVGREPNDAITFVQRICGVCPVPHGMTATFNVESVIGYNTSFQTWANGKPYMNDSGVTVTPVGGNPIGVPEKAVHIRNLVLGAEFLMSSLTHFYHLAAPSYVQGPNIPPWTPYFGENHYHPLLRSTGHGVNAAGGAGSTLPLDVEGFSKDLWSAVIKQYVKALRIRRLTFEAGAMFAGRMPMTSSLIAGGSGFPKGEDVTAKCTQFAALMTEIGTFVVKEYVPLVLALGALYPNYDNDPNALLADSVADPTGTTTSLYTLASPDNVHDDVRAMFGAGVGNFLAWGGFPQIDGTLALERGYKLNGDTAKTNISVVDVYANLRESIQHSRYIADQTKDNANATLTNNFTDPATETRTKPVRNDPAKYSWLKAPRWNGVPMEVGPFARMVVMGKIDAYTAATYHSTFGFGPYLKANGAAWVSGTPTGLEPKTVGADLAVALVRSGLAELRNGATNALITDVTTINTLTNAQIVAAYVLPTTEIRGIVFAWIANLKGGLSTMDRLRGRALESLILVQKIAGAITGASVTGGVTFAGGSGSWIGQFDAATGNTYIHTPVPVAKRSGFGATEAPRGALMHMCTIEKGKLTRYQCIVPTTWNASPKDAAGNDGPMEAAVVGTAFHSGAGWDAPYTKQDLTTGTAQSGVEALRVAQSFDPCIACAVH
jgi:Ni,Fe-hydrogenase I large subunit